jgi:hypothetical protein
MPRKIRHRRLAISVPVFLLLDEANTDHGGGYDAERAKRHPGLFRNVLK